VLGVGSASAIELAAAAGDGVLIRDLPMPKGNCRDGRIALSTPWAYRLVRGETKGRYERVTLKGNVFEWLNRVLLVGSDSRWIGARCLPDIVIDGAELTRSGF
jgi:predicted Zn-dependent protease